MTRSQVPSGSRRATWTLPPVLSAGLHALMTLPSGGEGEQEVCARAEASGVAIGRLGEHWHSVGPHPQGIIIGFGTPSDLVYPAALKALTDVLAQS